MICKTCDKEFEIKGNRKKFCSTKCLKKWFNNKYKTYRIEHYIKHKEKYKKSSKERYQKNREYILSRQKTPEIKALKNLYQKTPKRRSWHNNYIKSKRRTDVLFKIRTCIKDRLRKDTRLIQPSYKNVEEILHYSIKDLYHHLLTTLKLSHSIDDFMSGELEIDHIIPIGNYYYRSTNDEEFKKAWSIKNHRFIDKNENRNRRKNIDWNLVIDYKLKDILPKDPTEIYDELTKSI